MWGWRRCGIAVAAGSLVVLALAFYFIASEATGEAILPYIWPLMLIIAAALMVGLAIDPRRRILFRLAGPLAITAITLRPVGVLGNYWVGFTRSGWSVVAAFVIFPSWGGLGALWWFDRVGPWQERHEFGATVDGD